MGGNEINYFAGGNTAYGYVHHFESNFQQLDRLFILKGGPGAAKSTIMKSIGNEWYERGYDVEWIHSTRDVQNVDGVIIPQLKIGLVDGSFPHIVEPQFPIVVEEYVNVGKAFNRDELVPKKADIIQLTREIQRGYENVYDTFRKALEKHDRLESYYIKEIDRNKADQLTKEWIGDHIRPKKEQTNAIVKHRFLGASTPDGPVDFIENLTSTVTNRFFIKGRPGCGKSTMLKKLQKLPLKEDIRRKFIIAVSIRTVWIWSS